MIVDKCFLDSSLYFFVLLLFFCSKLWVLFDTSLSVLFSEMPFLIPTIPLLFFKDLFILNLLYNTFSLPQAKRGTFSPLLLQFLPWFIMTFCSVSASLTSQISPRSFISVFQYQSYAWSSVNVCWILNSTHQRLIMQNVLDPISPLRMYQIN